MANCKLIFIALLLVVVFFADEQVKIFAVAAMIVSIAMYFVSLHSIIRKLDKQGQIAPKGYSKQLARTIAVFMVMFTAALIVHLVI